LEAITSELQISPGKLFVLQGILVYVANVGEKEKRNFGNVNARLYCVFENGTESNMLLRSLAAALWKDENSRRVVDADQIDVVDESEKISPEDQATGFIYILRSLSDMPEIKNISNLYKIGFTSQPVEQRIQNATNESTFLMAGVKIVAEFQTYNLNPQKLELLLHTFFSESCLDLDVFDAEGNLHKPKEWFIVPLHIIQSAIHLLISGHIINFKYDSQKQEIVGK